MDSLYLGNSRLFCSSFRNSFLIDYVMDSKLNINSLEGGLSGADPVRYFDQFTENEGVSFM